MSFRTLMQRLGFGSPPEEAREQSAFQPQNELEELLIAAATDPEARPRFTQALLTSDLLVATPDAPAAPVERISEGETISILNVQTPEGTPMPGVFTSELRLAETFGAGAGYVGMNGRVLFEIIAESNPKSEMHIINEAGHFCYREQPETFNGIIKAFVEKCASL